MNPAQILKILQDAAPQVQWQVNGDGYRSQIEAVSELFADMNAVKRQQYVYQFLNAYIADGSIHAVSIQALTPQEKAQ